MICAGGSVHNRALMQLKADILGIPVSVPSVGEATLAGAAALLLKRQCGEKALAPFLCTAFSEKECFEPDFELHAQYRKIQEDRFLPMIEVLRRNLDIKNEREKI